VSLSRPPSNHNKDMNSIAKSDGARDDDISEVTASDVHSSIKPMKQFKNVENRRRESPSGMKQPS